jgi:hypothetical protein
LPLSSGPIELVLGDVVRLRRAHPCGGADWRVERLGADIGQRCTTCGRRVMLDRATLERRLAAFVERGDPALTAAATPASGSDPTPAPAR